MINGKKVVATIQGRMTSTRLPGKIMMPLAGKPIMQHMIERHRRSTYTDEIVVAITTHASDDPVVALCEQLGCAFFRGSETDVLGRIVEVGKEHDAEILVQGMADSPLVDWRIVDALIEMREEGNYDCAANEFEQPYPDGFDMRVYNFPTLLKAEQEDTSEAYREHAGYSIRSQPQLFTLGAMKAEGDFNWPGLRLTLDTEEDYKLLSAIYDELYPKNADFSAEDVVQFLKTRPDLVALNQQIKQKVPIVE